MPLILITPLSAVPDALKEHVPSHLVTLLSAEYMIETPEGLPVERHLRLSVHDISDPAGDQAPARRDAERLIEFGRGWDARAPMLIHCWAGVSRSTAAAYAILCDKLGPGREHDIAQRLRARAPHAQPNRLLVRHADDVLCRGGAMVRAVEAIGMGTPVTQGVPVAIPLYTE
ncbi:MAG: hypothetical protein JO261_11775 [Alphaproteobacteria bacterium]|nr:hypothetical protein [Alphaproteobacteria bacterium]MBV9694368.1 hypothetical protein [Alphaproteobacteria bacterium]